MEVIIKKPCLENWDAMTLNEQGAFCGKCAKTVIDFSNKSMHEIKEFLTTKQGQKVCGRFEKQQLTSLSFDAYFKKFKTLQFTKRFAVIVYFTFGICLFSSTSALAQTKEHLKGDVQIIDNTNKPVIMGGVRALPQKQDTAKTSVKSQNDIESVTGKVKCYNPKEQQIIPQKMGEVMILPNKSKNRQQKTNTTKKH